MHAGQVDAHRSANIIAFATPEAANLSLVIMDSFSSDDPSSCAHYSMVSNAKDKKVGGRRGKSIKLSTDAQSIAARQRRHRISERFKILQSLVPGGSKMDTVSMLEEAINYVKFLKTQIWLHQSMINSVDADPKLFFPPITRPLEQNHDLLTQRNVDDCEVNAMTRVEVPNSASPIDETMPFYARCFTS